MRCEQPVTGHQLEYQGLRCYGKSINVDNTGGPRVLHKREGLYEEERTDGCSQRLIDPAHRLTVSRISGSGQPLTGRNIATMHDGEASDARQRKAIKQLITLNPSRLPPWPGLATYAPPAGVSLCATSRAHFARSASALWCNTRTSIRVCVSLLRHGIRGLEGCSCVKSCEFDTANVQFFD